MTRTLVVGGTGPSGPHVLSGLLRRGHDVTIFHRGVHEPPDLVDVEHLHGDPHFRESIDEALAGREFDVVLAMYGRIKHLAPALAGRCGQFVSVGGVPVYQGFFPRADQLDLPIPIREGHPVVADTANVGDDDAALVFSRRLAQAEDIAFEHHPGATVFRFSTIYGPNNARPAEWSVLRRVRDGRTRMILPDGGGQVHSRCAARNAAAFVLAAVDQPEAAAGQAFNCGDPVNWSLRQWAAAVAALAGADLELIPIPSEIAVEAATTLLPLANTTATHVIVSTEKARRVLGYEPVVEPMVALEELVRWYESHPEHDADSSPSLTDRFDYPTEDALIEAYRRAGEQIHTTVGQHPAPPVHSMPHPKTPGGADHRGR